MKTPLSLPREPAPLPLPAAPWRELARLHCLALAVERRAAGASVSEITGAAEVFYQWVLLPPADS